MRRVDEYHGHRVVCHHLMGGAVAIDREILPQEAVGAVVDKEALKRGEHVGGS